LKPVLVTGITGFLGANLLKSLLAKDEGALVCGLVRGTRRIDPSLSKSVKILKGDVTNPSSLQRKFRGVHTVVHLASKVVASEPAEYQRVNVEGTRNVAECCANEGVERLIYVSSAAIYGFAVARDEEEHEPLEVPVTPVSQSRYEAEKVLLEYHRKNRINVSILRPLFVYGNGDRFFIPSILRTLRHFPFLINRGTARFSVISATELGDAIVALVTADLPAPDYPVFHATDGAPVSLAEVVGRLCEGLQLHYPSMSLPYHVAVPSMIIAGLGKSIFSHVADQNQTELRDITTIELRHRFHLVSYDHYFSNKRLTNLLPEVAFSTFSQRIDSFIPYYRSLIF
jgi:nucleoside-diphosphate-sugar epimerase